MYSFSGFRDCPRNQRFLPKQSIELFQPAMKKTLLLSALALAFAPSSFGQTVTMGPQTGVFNSNTRGYHFTSPANITITGVKVLLQTGSANTLQNFAILKFDAATPPPPFNMVTNAFTQEALGFDLDQTVFQPVNVSVAAGEVIGVYGNTVPSVGVTAGANSYAGVVQQTAMIAGSSVDLFRTGMQFHLGMSTQPGGMMDVWSEPTGFNITRVEFTYVLGAGGAGTPFCNPNENNSTGVPTVMTASFGTGVGSDLNLEAAQGPTGQFGYFLVGTASTEPGIMLPNSNGRLCLLVGAGNSIGRYNITGTQFNSLGLFDAAGNLINQVGTSLSGNGFDVPVTLPIAGSPQIMTGQTWHFQLWHRENGGLSNFSNGLSVAF